MGLTDRFEQNLGHGQRVPSVWLLTIRTQPQQVTTRVDYMSDIRGYSLPLVRIADEDGTGRSGLAFKRERGKYIVLYFVVLGAAMYTVYHEDYFL